MSKLSKKIKKLRERLRKLSPRTKQLLIAGGVLLLIVVVALILLFISHQASYDVETSLTPAEQKQHEAQVEQVHHDGEIYVNASKALEQGGVEAANQVYTEAVNAETDTTHKIELILNQSELYYNANKYEDAIKVAKQAESLSTDKYLVADWLSRIYEDQHQYKLAADYYTLAGKWVTSKTNKTGLTKAHYDTEAARVTALVGQK